MRLIHAKLRYIPDISGLPLIIDTKEDELEKPTTKQELDHIPNFLEITKRQDQMGIQQRFFKHIWDARGDFCFKAISESLEGGKLADSQTKGIITCLPKQGNVRNLLKNWKPLSLLNTMYKFLSLTITNRIKNCLAGLASK